MPENNQPRFPAAQGKDAGQSPDRDIEDPLAELARIVSVRPDPEPQPEPFTPSAEEAPASGGAPVNGHQPAVPAAAAPKPPSFQPRALGQSDPLGPGLIDDLEAELLSNLQASFSAVEESAGRQPAPPAPPSVTHPPAEAPPSPQASQPPVQAEHEPPAPPSAGYRRVPAPSSPGQPPSDPSAQSAPPPAMRKPEPSQTASRASGGTASPAEALDAPSVLRQRIRGYVANEAQAADEQPPAAPPAPPAPGPLPDADPFAVTAMSVPPQPVADAAEPASNQAPDADAPAPRWPPRMDDMTDEWLNDISGLRPGSAAGPASEQQGEARPAEERPRDERPVSAPARFAPTRSAPPPQADAETARPQPETAAPPASDVPVSEDSEWDLDTRRPAGKRLDAASLPLRRSHQPDGPEVSTSPQGGEGAPVPAAQATAAPVVVPDDPAGEAQRPTPAPQPAQSRWDQPESGESRFAPRGRQSAARRSGERVVQPQPVAAAPAPAAVAPSPADVVPEPQHDLADPALFEDGQEPPRSRLANLLGRASGREAPPQPDIPDDDMFPADDDLPPFETDDLKGLIGRRRPPIGLLAGGALLAVVAIVGGAALFLMNTGAGTDGPIIVAAESGPFKITPDPVETGAGEPNKLIYDRVDGSPDAGQEVIVLQPGAEVPLDRSADPNDNPIARVILPDGITGGGPPSASDGPDTPEAIDLGPRRVRTVVVRPDGTIVSNTTEGSGTELALAPEPAPVTTDDTLAIAGSGANGGSELAITPNPPPLPAAPPVQATPQQPALALAPEPVQTVPQPAPPQPAPPQAAPPQPATPQPATPRPAAPAQTAVAPQSSGPLDLTQPAATTSRPAASGGMLVQISSQRSEESARATFSDLKARYPGILGPFDVNIQRADLGARGIYYRVRVGPFSPNDAQRLCDDLKAAGGDCILSRS